MTIHIRTALPHELIQLVQLEQLLIDNHPWSISDYKSSIQQQHQRILVALNQQKKIMATLIYSLMLDQMEILRFWVGVEFQRMGIASKLLNHLINFAPTKSVKEIFLEVRINNFVAIALYYKFNFKLISIRKNYYTIANQQFDGLLLSYSW